MDAMVTDHAAQMINALVTTVLMAIQHGQTLIALEELVLNLPHGLEQSKMPMTHIPSLSAPTKAHVTENLVNASALRTTMGSPASVQCAQIDAVMPVCASLRSSWPLKRDVFILLLGMLKNKLDVCAILVDVVLTALFSSAHLDLMY
jgi:hypothetical protein